MDAFLVPQPTDTVADADSDGDPDTDSAPDEQCDATEHAHGDPSGATTEPLTKKRRRRSTVVSDDQPGDATERADDSEDDCREACLAAMTSADAALSLIHI